MPKRSQEEIDADVEYFINHPINAKKITPELMERPEYQALSQLLHDGTPDEIAKNFMVTTTTTPYPNLFIESRLGVFDQGAD